jgi:hypothetical protein
LKGQWAIVYRPGRQPFSDLDASIYIAQPFSVTDTVKGLGYASIQFNVRGQGGNSFQNVLALAPDKLVWSLSVFDKSFDYVLNRQLDALLDLNVADLAGCSIRMGFWQDEEMVVEIRDTDQNLVQGLHTSIPGKYADPIISGYVAFCGWGDRSTATFQGLSASVKLQSLEQDIIAEAFPYADNVPAFSTAEASNTYEDVQATVPGEVVVAIGVGPWV